MFNLVVYILVALAAILLIATIVYGTKQAKDTALTTLGLEISADDDAGSCKDGEVLYGINNYPYLSNPTESGAHSKYTDKMPSGTWKCSAVCGPSDPDKFAKEFLPSLKVQNKELNILGDKNAFDALVARITSKDEVLDRTVILQSSLARKGKGCFGPSEDYKNLTGAKLTEENTTAADQKKAQEEKKKKLAEEAKKREAAAKKTASSSSSGSSPSSNTAAGRPEEQMFIAPTSGGTGNVGSSSSSSDDEKITDGEKDKISLVGPCWQEFNEVAVNHMKAHLGKYDLYGDTTMEGEKIIRDLKTELGGGWVYKDSKDHIRTVPADSKISGEPRNYKQIDGLHYQTGEALAKQIGEYYGEYRKYALNDEISKDPKKEEKMLKQCEEVKERIENSNIGREDVALLQSKHKKIVELLEKVNKIDTGYTKISSAEGFLGFASKDGAQSNSTTFLTYLTRYFKTPYDLDEKILLNGFYGIYNVKKFNDQADKIIKELNDFIAQRPFVANKNKNVTIKFQGYIATSQESISKDGDIKNGSAPVHVCVYLLVKDATFDSNSGCNKVKTKARDGKFEVEFSVSPQRYAEIRSQDKVFKLYAEYNGTWGAVRNTYESVKVNHDPQAYTGTSDGKIYYSIKRDKNHPFILKGDPHFGPNATISAIGVAALNPAGIANAAVKSLRKIGMDKPQYQVAGKNMVVETSKQFMKDTGGKKCYER